MFRIEVLIGSVPSDLERLRTEIREYLQKEEERAKVSCTQNLPRPLPVNDIWPNEDATRKIENADLYIGIVSKTNKTPSEVLCRGRVSREFASTEKLKLDNIAFRRDEDYPKWIKLLQDWVPRIIQDKVIPLIPLRLLKRLKRWLKTTSPPDPDFEEFLDTLCCKNICATKSRLLGIFREKLKEMHEIVIGVETPYATFDKMFYRTRLKQSIAKDCREAGFKHVKPEDVWLRRFSGDGDCTVLLTFLPKEAIRAYLEMKGQWRGNVIDAQLPQYQPPHQQPVWMFLAEEASWWRPDPKRLFDGISPPLYYIFLARLLISLTQPRIRVRRVFVSYDCVRDRQLKKTLSEQIQAETFHTRKGEVALPGLYFSDNDSAGHAWRSTTTERIRRADCVVVIVTSESNRPTNVRREIEIAKTLNKRIRYLCVQDIEKGLRDTLQP